MFFGLSRNVRSQFGSHDQRPFRHYLRICGHFCSQLSPSLINSEIDDSVLVSSYN